MKIINNSDDLKNCSSFNIITFTAEEIEEMNRIQKMTKKEFFEYKIAPLKMSFAGFLEYESFRQNLSITEKKECETELMNDFDEILMLLINKINEINEILYHNKRERQSAMGAGYSDRIGMIYLDTVMKHFYRYIPKETVNEDSQKDSIVLNILVSNYTASFYSNLCTNDSEYIYQKTYGLLYYYTMSLIMSKYETKYMILGEQDETERKD